MALAMLAGLLGCSSGSGGTSDGGSGGASGAGGTSASGGSTGSGGATSAGGSGGGKGGAGGAGTAGAGGSAGSTGADGGGATDGGAGDGGTTSNDGGGTDGLILTAAEMTSARKLTPLPAAPPADTTNRFADNAAAATLGQRLFFERGFSGALAVASDGINGSLGAAGDTGKVACASCHMGAALDDRRSNPNNVSLGVNYLTRNAPALVNASFYTWTNWAGRFSAQWELPMAVVENAKNMGGDRLRVAHTIFSKYRADYEAVVGSALPDALGSDTTRFPPSGKPMAAGGTPGPWETMTATDQATVNALFVNFGKILEAYLRKLVSGDSRFDRYMAGDMGALTASEVDGLKVFVGKGQCDSCHGGPAFTDNKFHNLGLPQVGPNVPATDLGRFTDITGLLTSAFNTGSAASDDTTTGRLAGLTNPPPDDTKGQFRTPSLRNVSATGPYMHAGQLDTLEAVVSYYDTIGGSVPAAGTLDPLLANLGLTSQEKADLVAFLGALASAPLAPSLTGDTSAP
jgi:cytochrome c peroxidase